MRWIGLTGKMGAGKDYTFMQLCSVYKNLVRVSFADQLRYEVENTIGMPIPALWNKPYPEEIRRLLQWWGTDLRRADDPDYWVKMGEEAAKGITNGGVPVFTDVRLPNEANMIRRNGGMIVRVHAPRDVREARLGGPPPNHESETAMDHYTVDLSINSQPGEDYERGLDRLLRKAGQGLDIELFWSRNN